MRLLKAGWWGLVLLCCMTSAWAGRTCDAPKPPRTATLTQALTLAERTLTALDRSGAQVVVLGRAGQDLSEYGLHYSHLGLAYRQDNGTGGHVWRVLHKLNTCGTATAALYRQGLGEFFMDDLWRYEATWVVPTAAVQARLLAVLQDPSQAVHMHHRPYSMVSYAWGNTYQQSNQWALETLAMAMLNPPSGYATRQQAQAWLQQQGYQPTVLKLNTFKRLGARVTTAHIAFDDHPPEKRFSGRIATVTVDSVLAWMLSTGLAESQATQAL